MKIALIAAAAAFYFVLAIYIASELHYNRDYWRIILRKKRASRWEYLLWIERVFLLLFGIIVIVITVYFLE